VAGVFGEELLDAGTHRPSVAEDVVEELPGDAVVDAQSGVLAATVAETALQDAPQAGTGGRVEEDDCVGGNEPDRQGGGAVPVDDPAWLGDQVALEPSEPVGGKWVPVAVVERASRW
jgi:hypothetical protein